ncbi:MAG: transporter substrate-binding domain-containing protein [Synergistaceae bacterium]|nr:transporter substrate-binding domain-containing protein [Synergistaceae bacterium]
MKKFLFVVVVLMSVFFYWWGHDINKIEIIRVGSDCGYPPQNWEEDRSTNSNVPISNKAGFYAEGYDIQIARRVAGNIGAKLEVKKIAWSDLFSALNRREIDAVFSGLLDTKAHKEQAAFTETYEVRKTEYVLLMNKGSRYSVRKRIDDFAGVVLIARTGTTFEAAIDQIPGAKHAPSVENVDDMMKKVIAHEADGALVDIDTGRSCEKTYPHLKMIRFPEGKGFTLPYTGICAAVRKRDKHLLEAINSALEDISPRDRQRIMDATIAREWENLRQY